LTHTYHRHTTSGKEEKKKKKKKYAVATCDDNNVRTDNTKQNVVDVEIAAIATIANSAAFTYNCREANPL
jgi:hypothetical protein